MATNAPDDLRFFSATALLVGALGLVGGVLVARSTPATGYELSIYAATPVETWAGFAVAYLVAVSLALGSASGRYRVGALVLGSLTTVGVVALPLIRGYRLLGAGDALTHLGWTKDIGSGILSPYELFYPALHLSTLALEDVGGVPINRGSMIVTLVAVTAFLIFVPMTIRALSASTRSIILGVVITWLLLPVNHVSVHLQPHPSTLALFVFSFALFIVVLHLRRPASEAWPFAVSPFLVVFVLVSVGVVLYHPQQTLSLVLLLAGATVAQILARRRFELQTAVSHRGLAVPTAVVSVFFAVWTLPKPKFRAALTGVTEALTTESSGGAGSEVAQRSGSLTQLGADILELYLKLFALETVFLGVIVLVGVLLFSDRIERRPTVDVPATYLAVGSVPVFALFAVLFVGTSTQAFRVVGFLLVLGTVFSALAVARMADGLERPLGRRVVSRGLVVAASIALVLSVVVVFSSPYVFQPTSHVSDEQYDGFETVFDVRASGVEVAGVSGAGERYADAIEGTAAGRATDLAVGSGPGEGVLSPTNFSEGRYTARFELEAAGDGGDTEGYIVVTRSDREREITLYDGFDYTRAGFDGLDRDQRLSLVVANDELRLYYLNVSTTSVADSDVGG